MSEAEIESAKAWMKFLPPSVLAEIAAEICESNCPVANEIVEICFDIERTNNGASEFIKAINLANR